VTTLLGCNRAEVLGATYQKGDGHSFWTHDEKELFRLIYFSYVKRNRKPTLSSVKSFLQHYLTSIYPMFRDSLCDFHIQRSVYDCLRNMVKKRQYPNREILASSLKSVFGPLAVTKNDN
jgi:hypothetical protein